VLKSICHSSLLHLPCTDCPVCCSTMPSQLLMAVDWSTDRSSSRLKVKMPRHFRLARRQISLDRTSPVSLSNCSGIPANYGEPAESSTSNAHPNLTASPTHADPTVGAHSTPEIDLTHADPTLASPSLMATPVHYAEVAHAPHLGEGSIPDTLGDSASESLQISDDEAVPITHTAGDGPVPTAGMPRDASVPITYTLEEHAVTSSHTPGDGFGPTHTTGDVTARNAQSAGEGR